MLFMWEHGPSLSLFLYDSTAFTPTSLGRRLYHHPLLLHHHLLFPFGKKLRRSSRLHLLTFETAGSASLHPFITAPTRFGHKNSIVGIANHCHYKPSHHRFVWYEVVQAALQPRQHVSHLSHPTRGGHRADLDGQRTHQTLLPRPLRQIDAQQ